MHCLLIGGGGKQSSSESVAAPTVLPGTEDATVPWRLPLILLVEFCDKCYVKHIESVAPL